MPGRSEDKIEQCYKEASQHCHIGSHQLVLAMMNLYACTIFFHLSHCMNEHFKIKISFLNLIFFSFLEKASADRYSRLPCSINLDVSNEVEKIPKDSITSL